MVQKGIFEIIRALEVLNGVNAGVRLILEGRRELASAIERGNGELARAARTKIHQGEEIAESLGDKPKTEV